MQFKLYWYSKARQRTIIQILSTSPVKPQAEDNSLVPRPNAAKHICELESKFF